MYTQEQKEAVDAAYRAHIANHMADAPASVLQKSRKELDVACLERNRILNEKELCECKSHMGEVCEYFEDRGIDCSKTRKDMESLKVGDTWSWGGVFGGGYKINEKI